MAAEAAAAAGARVTVRDQRRSFGRTLLLAGRSGLNLTHDEPLETFLGRYSTGRELVEPAIRAFPPSAVRAWADELGADTFVGSSGRVFPAAMRATALVRAWLVRLADLGVAFEPATPWSGFDDTSEHTVLALGGASWPQVGGDGSWVAVFRAAGFAVDPLVASNAGVEVEWSAPLLDRFEGTPLKNVAVSIDGETVRGEPTITAAGLEGGPTTCWDRGFVRPSPGHGRRSRSICNPTFLRPTWRIDLPADAARRTHSARGCAAPVCNR